METKNDQQQANEKHLAGTVGGADIATTRDGEQIGEQTHDAGTEPDEENKEGVTSSGSKNDV